MEVDNEPGPSAAPLFVRQTLEDLRSSSAGFLVHNTPIKSTSKPPSFSAHKISPMKSKSRYSSLLQTPARTDQETKLRDALIESEARDAVRKEIMIGMQAGVILSNIYAVQVNKQLQAKEAKEKGKGKTKLMGDGKAKLFTGDEFFRLCEEHEKQQKEDAENAIERRNFRQIHAERLAEWKKENEAIKERNKLKKADYDLAVVAWEEEKAKAKEEKRKPRWNKPKWREDFKPETLKQRPKKNVEGEEEDDESDESGDEHELN
ncbi:hypothetical protein F5051DRAFT_334200 [Lentinula edodes]|nr:hypothetical protein F5051DRAFT_334200 [Lentinula edodes]